MPRILIVEDDPMISEIYQKKFSEAKFDVSVAMSGEEAISKLKKEKFDLMLLDLMMPKVDGFEVIKFARLEESNKEIKIFVSSNLSQREEQEKAIKLGADEFIIKANYAPGDLVKEIVRFLRQDEQVLKNKAKREEMSNNDESEAKENSDKKKILFIEDEEIFLDMFGGKLRQDGYEVETASNGAWGMKEALKKDFDIFIIDMVMPAMTGDEIVEKLKMDEKTKNKPIIVLSASVDSQTEKKVKEMGVNEFFVKTQIIPSELSEKVENLIGK